MSHLVIGRRPGQSIRINGPCRVTIEEIRGGHVRVGVEADRSVAIVRDELDLPPRKNHMVEPEVEVI